MKVRVYDNPGGSEVLMLKLVQDCNDVVLVAVDKNGEPLPCGRILIIRDNGRLELCSGVSATLGIRIDESSGAIFVY